VTAPKVGAPGAGVEAGNQAQEGKEQQRRDSIDQPLDLQAAKRKQFEHLRALLALKGHELHATDGGIYIVRRWGLCRDLRDLAAVEDFAKQVGAL
jgi:hypothetical protein